MLWLLVMNSSIYSSKANTFKSPGLKMGLYFDLDLFRPKSEFWTKKITDRVWFIVLIIFTHTVIYIIFIVFIKRNICEQYMCKS